MGLYRSGRLGLIPVSNSTKLYTAHLQLKYLYAVDHLNSFCLSIFARYGAGGFGSRDYRQYQNRGNQGQGGYRGSHDHGQNFGGNRGGFGGYNSGGYNNFVQHHHMGRGPQPNARPAVNDWFDS